jgi:hypothetical protein
MNSVELLEDLLERIHKGIVRKYTNSLLRVNVLHVVDEILSEFVF